MSDLISRADAIEEISKGVWNVYELIDRINTLPSADADFADLPDIPRAYYERIVGNMAHEINMLKEQLESADAEQGFRGGKIPPKEMLDGTVLIPKHQWLEMERELAELKDKFESADAVHGEWIEREDWNGDYYYDCSVCGESFVLCDGTPSMNLYHFCPNCGARMKGGAE